MLISMQSFDTASDITLYFLTPCFVLNNIQISEYIFLYVIPCVKDQYDTKCPVYQPAKAGVVEKGARCTPWDSRNGDRSHTAFPIINILSNAAAGIVRISQRHWRCALSLTASPISRDASPVSGHPII